MLTESVGETKYKMGLGSTCGCRPHLGSTVRGWAAVPSVAAVGMGDTWRALWALGLKEWVGLG